MNILVTGGEGYIGSETCRQLIEKGHKVISLDNSSSGNKRCHVEGLVIVRADARMEINISTIILKYKIDLVIHLAAKIKVKESIEQSLVYYDNNVISTISLLKAMKQTGVNKLVFASTASIYGNNNSDFLINEWANPMPINPYAKSKYFCEEIIEDAYKSWGLNYVNLRFFNVAGASETVGQTDKAGTHLIKVLCEQLCGKREVVEIYGNCMRDYTHVSDISNAIILSAFYLRQGGYSYTFNVGYGEGFSTQSVIEMMEKVAGKEINKIYFQETRSGDPERLIADPKKIKDTLGWKPQHQGLEHICRSALVWEKRQNDAIV